LKDGHWHPVDLPPGSSRPRDIIIDTAGKLIVLLSNRALAMMDDGGPPRVVSGETLDVAGITGVFPTDFGLLVAGGTGIALWDGHKV
ncbi:hypothetical protein, partial [Streptomyces brasiliscabiei]|uniref:hypothetical protein n=1 Tax=Streptomyces brasiliscabiei TaxID=2736302 RepID=UPI003014DDB3